MRLPVALAVVCPVVLRPPFSDLGLSVFGMSCNTCNLAGRADEVKALLAGHPRQAKARLGMEIAAFYHGDDAARAASDAFDRQFQEGALPDDIPEHVFAGEWPADGLPLSGWQCLARSW